MREEVDGTLKYSLSNAAADTRWDRLAFTQAQPIWIERCFQNALGMVQYDVRGWPGRHHQIVLVYLALLVLLQERCRAKMRQMQRRHAAGQRELDNHRRRLRRATRKLG